MKRLPPWIRMNLHTDQHYADVSKILSERNLHTVCKSAKCPNRHACWNEGTATFMIMGNTCSRNCVFCGIGHGRPENLAADEPSRVAEASQIMNLRYVVITSVTRDDLADGGATHFAATIDAVRAIECAPLVEVLIPDFCGDQQALQRIMQAEPVVINHNLETVQRIQSEIRPQASYKTSLGVLRYIAGESDIPVKSGLMVGLGETDDEVLETINDLAGAGCRILTIGQYLQPTRSSWPVDRYVSPDVFDMYRIKALDAGISAVASAPLVRSSYHAEQLLRQVEE